MNEYEIIEISDSEVEQDSNFGGMFPKIWVKNEKIGRALFKEATTKNGWAFSLRTDWSEKAVSELNQLVGLPSAQYELASLVDGDKRIRGSVSLDLKQAGDINRLSLEELLNFEIDNYDYGEDYTVENVVKALQARDVTLPPGYDVPEGIVDGVDMFVGILMVDAWIADGDRHDQNIEIVLSKDGEMYLSPVFDHGLSLGADIEPRNRESTPIQEFDKESNKSFFRDEYGDRLSGKEALERAIAIRPKAGQIWLEQLAKVKQSQIDEIFQKIGEERITENESAFARLILDYGQKQLLTLQEKSLSKDELKSLYKDYSEQARGLGLEKTKAIARHGFEEKLDRSQVHQMLKQNDEPYRNIVNSVGENLAIATVVISAQIDLVSHSSKERQTFQSQEKVASMERER